MDPCPSAHCSGIQGPVNEVCKASGWGINHPVIVQKPDGTICYCSCSCLAFGTPVQTEASAYKAIQEFAVGDTVLACGLDLHWSTKKVQFSNGTAAASRQKYTVLTVYGETAIATTSDHIFVLKNKRLKRADRLAPGDELLTPDGGSVTVSSVHIGDYVAGFHHIATDIEVPGSDLKGHLINTNGVVSGDYAVQLYARDNSLEAEFVDDHRNLPIVGSPEYIALYSDASRKGPAGIEHGELLTSVDHRNYFAISKSAVGLNVPHFIPANSTISQIPPDAASFISEEEARLKAQDEMRSWNDPLSRQWTQYLLEQHAAFYPTVNYQLDWADDTVNAYAWVQNGQRFVAIKGGLVRHVALALEGIALVIAHETGHHFGGPPTFPGGLSCEGQADYAGVRDVMRKIWFGDQYAKMALGGIAQMANFFGVPNSPTVPGGHAGCEHPPGACRIATYYAALRLEPKPSCAAFVTVAEGDKP